MYLTHMALVGIPHANIFAYGAVEDISAFLIPQYILFPFMMTRLVAYALNYLFWTGFSSIKSHSSQQDPVHSHCFEVAPSVVVSTNFLDSWASCLPTHLFVLFNWISFPSCCAILPFICSLLFYISFLPSPYTYRTCLFLFYLKAPYLFISFSHYTHSFFLPTPLRPYFHSHIKAPCP